MPVTNHFYGGKTIGAGRTIQDIGLCDLKGNYVQTTKLRQKGLLVAVFFTPDSPLSERVLGAVQSWTAEIPQEKWSAVGIAESEQPALQAWTDRNQFTNISFLLDYGLYQTQTLGISRLPSLFLISPKGQVLEQVTGADEAGLAAAKARLNDEIAAIAAAEQAAKEAARKAEEVKKAEEEKKAAEAAAKPAAAAKA